MRSLKVFCLVAVCFGVLSAQLVTDPLPYAEIANPLPDTMDQLYRDSINIKFSPIRVNQAGYRPQDNKYFYYVGSASSFKVIDEDGNDAGSGTLKSTSHTVSGQLKIRASNNATLVSGGDTRYTMQSPVYSGALSEGLLPQLTPGKYRVVVGKDTSAEFVVDERLYGWVRDALLKFYGANRCGDSQSWFHSACHLKDEVTGGWHDCGDHLKEGATMSYTAAVLGLAAAAFSDRDADVYSANQGVTLITDGMPDMLYEAKHGSDFILRSYDKAGGAVANMITSIGGFGGDMPAEDHSWWGRPEYQDKMPMSRGGPPRPARNEPTTDYLGKYAANLAFVSKCILPYDVGYAERCLKAAKAIYEFTKPRMDRTNTPAYNGETNVSDDAAFACLALLWATGERKYLDDLCYDKAIGKLAKSEAEQPKLFNGGWFTNYDPVFYHASANTDWASDQAHVLWGFFKLVLSDTALCQKLNLSESDQLKLLEKTVYNLIANLGSVGLGNESIQLPNNGFWVPPIIKYELPWFTMHTQMEWVWNRYQSGNITEMFYYYDIATAIQGLELPTTPASTDWKADTVKTVLIRMMDYMFGVNPWDISMVYGVGDKNFNHPHHRAANPEGKNVPGAFYKYIPPVGALQGGYKPLPGANLYSEHFDDYHHSETGIDGTTNLLMPVTGLAKEISIGPPTGTVRIVYVGCDNAIIEIRQSRFGDASINYGKEDVLGKVERSDSAGVLHRIELTGLDNGVTYKFTLTVEDLFGRESVIKDLNEDKVPVPFEFTTKQNCPTNAEISNVKICKVTSDSAEIFWYTPNGEFDSRITYGENIPPTRAFSGDVAGVPVKFHYIKIGGLKEKTKYFFYVESGDSRDDNKGRYYSFTTPVEHVSFDVRAVRYVWEGMPTIGLNIMNQDIKTYDSLEMRLYVRGPETYSLKSGTFGRTSDTVVRFQDHIMFRVDIGIKYRSDGFQDKHFKTELDKYVQNAKPVRIEDTYDDVSKTWGYYIPVPMGNAVMESGARFRIDISMLARSPFYPYLDAWNSPSLKEFTDADWSFGPHSRANGEPYDYDGVPISTKEAVDSENFNTPINYYITVYRKGEYVWGYSPSYEEMKTKKTHYDMTSQVTSPLNNPSEDYVEIKKLARAVDVSGWAKITPVDGIINDIWVNGVAVKELSKVIKWNETDQRYDFTVPVPVKNGANSVDLTIFGGPSEDCEECYGCANSNHSFYIKFEGAKQYPSNLSLKDLDMDPLNDTAKIDTTVFHVVVTDRNGNAKGKAVDTLYVDITNPELGDSIRVMLLETGDSTNTFKTVSPIKVVSLAPSESGKNQISMAGGDKVWVKYIDPTDSTDSSQAYIVSKADFPIAKSGWIDDTDGDGAIDLMVVRYSIPVKNIPDSISLAFPKESKITMIKSSKVDFTRSDDSMELSIEFDPSLQKGVTGFFNTAFKQGKSYLTYQGAVKVSSFYVADSAGPVLIGEAYTVENDEDDKEDIQTDSLSFRFSEAIPMQLLIGDTLLLNKSGVDFPLYIERIVKAVPDSNSYTVIVKGTQKIAKGDSLKLYNKGAVTDYTGNHAHKFNPNVPIKIRASVPKINQAYYVDGDGDGLIDTVTAIFSKDIERNGFKSLSFKWKDKPSKEVDLDAISFAEGSKRKIRFSIEKLLDETIITSGKIRLFVVLKEFSDIIEAEVNDSAAPVITNALFYAKSDTLEDTPDTLKIKFSEDVAKIGNKEPFKFYSKENNKKYTLTLKVPGNIKGDEHVFLVTSVNDIEMPQSGDSVKINIESDIHDMYGNRQMINENRKCVLEVIKQIPDFEVIITLGPNPLVINKSRFDDNDAPEDYKQKYGIVFKLENKRGANLGAILDIFDPMGNKIFTDNTPDLSRSQSKSKVFFLWDGTNKNYRYVGDGTYLAIVKSWNKDDINARPTASRFKIGVKRQED